MIILFEWFLKDRVNIMIDGPKLRAPYVVAVVKPKSMLFLYFYDPCREVSKLLTLEISFSDLLQAS